MRNPGIRRLQALRDAALREAMQAALDHPDDDVRGKIERIEAYDRLLAAAPSGVGASWLGGGRGRHLRLAARGRPEHCVPATRIVLEVTAGTSTWR